MVERKRSIVSRNEALHNELGWGQQEGNELGTQRDEEGTEGGEQGLGKRGWGSIGGAVGGGFWMADCDLRDKDELRATLEGMGVDFELPTLVISECVLIYMPPDEVRSGIWGFEGCGLL